MNKLLQYLQSNKEWLFSGLGIAILSTLFLTLQQSFESFKNAKRGSISKHTSGDIRVIGPRAAGKTVYLAAMADWHNLGNISPIYSIEPINDDATKLVRKAQNILRQGDILEATNLNRECEIPFYSLQIEIVFNPHFWPLYFLLRKHLIFTVSFKDYAGEFFQEMAHEQQGQSYLTEYLDDCALSSRMMIVIDSLVSSKKVDLEYALAIKNLGQELDMRLKKGSRNLSNYRIAVVLTKFDQLQVWKYRNEPREFFQRQFPRTYNSLQQLMNKEKCLISYFSCSAFGIKGEPPHPNAIGYGDGILFVLQDPKLWQPFGLIAPIYWLCTGHISNRLREF